MYNTKKMMMSKLFQNDEQPIDHSSALISEAIKRDDLNFIEFLLEKKNILSDSKNHSCWLLHEAINSKNAKIVSKLLQHGACVESCSSVTWPNSAMHEAVATGCKPVIEELLLYNANWQKRNKFGDTVLHLAFNNYHLPDTHVSIEKIAEIKAESEKIIIQTLELFLKMGMDVNARNKKKHTPLYLASMNRMINVATFLLDRGAKISEDELFIHSLIINASETIECENDSVISQSHVIYRVEQDIEFFDWLLSKGFNADLKNHKKKTAVQVALEYKMVYLLPTLLKYANDLKLENTRTTMLHILLNLKPLKKKTSDDVLSYLILKNRPQDVNEAAKIMIDKGVSVDTYDECGMPPCVLAAQQKRIGLLKHMFNHMSNRMKVTRLIYLTVRTWIDNVDDYYEDGLDEVITMIVKYTFDRGIDFNLKLLLYAAKHKLNKTVDLLQKCGVHFQICNSNGENVLHLAMNKSYLSKKDTQVLNEIFKFAIKHGCDVNGKTKIDKTPFHEAVLSGNIDAMNILIENGANLYEIQRDGKTALHLAVKHLFVHQSSDKDCVNLIKFFIDKGFDLDSKANDGQTALHLAAKFGQVTAAKILIENGANIHATDDFKTQHMPLHLAAKYKYKSVVELLTEQGANVNARQSEGLTPLEMAIDNKDDFPNTKTAQDIIQFLIDKGSNVNNKSKDGKTPLHRAVEFGKVAIVIILLRYGANVNAKEDILHYTPIHLAAKNNCHSITRILIGKHADMNARENTGKTPLHLAISHKHNNLMNILLGLGADYDAEDYEGHVPLQTALEYNNKKALICLLEFGADASNVENMPFPVECNNVWDAFFQYFYKLSILDLPYPNTYGIYFDRYRDQFDSDRFAERDKLKSFMIEESVTMYDFLYMNAIKRFMYTKHEKLKNLNSWVSLEFPLYSSIIIAKYKEGVEKIPLRESAKKAWLELTGIYLPNICIERIFDYCKTSSLKNMVGWMKKNTLKRPAEKSASNPAKKIDRKNSPIEIICLD